MDVESVTLTTAFITLTTAVVVGLIMVWREIRGVHRLINSRMEELLELTRQVARAEGLKEGREEPQDD